MNQATQSTGLHPTMPTWCYKHWKRVRVCHLATFGCKIWEEASMAIRSCFLFGFHFALFQVWDWEVWQETFRCSIIQLPISVFKPGKEHHFTYLPALDHYCRKWKLVVNTNKYYILSNIIQQAKVIINFFHCRYKLSTFRTTSLCFWPERTSIR